jgi:hypothetical protein
MAYTLKIRQDPEMKPSLGLGGLKGNLVIDIGEESNLIDLFDLSRIWIQGSDKDVFMIGQVLKIDIPFLCGFWSVSGKREFQVPAQISIVLQTKGFVFLVDDIASCFGCWNIKGGIALSACNSKLGVYAKTIELRQFPFFASQQIEYIIIIECRVAQYLVRSLVF